jgi:hypothetical protein
MSTISTIEKNVVGVGKYVGTEHVDSLIRNYKKERWIQNSERIGKEDTLGIWLTTAELENFIETAKLHGADGIRLYFGVYGKNQGRPGMEGRQTVAFVATRSEEEADQVVHRDLYVERGGEKGLVAYNMWPWTTPPSTAGASLGIAIVSDKDNNQIVI